MAMCTGTKAINPKNLAIFNHKALTKSTNLFNMASITLKHTIFSVVGEYYTIIER